VHLVDWPALAGPVRYQSLAFFNNLRSSLDWVRRQQHKTYS